MSFATQKRRNAYIGKPAPSEEGRPTMTDKSTEHGWTRTAPTEEQAAGKILLVWWKNGSPACVAEGLDYIDPDAVEWWLLIPSPSDLTDEQFASLACGDDPFPPIERKPGKSRAAKTVRSKRALAAEPGPWCRNWDAARCVYPARCDAFCPSRCPVRPESAPDADGDDRATCRGCGKTYALSVMRYVEGARDWVCKECYRKIPSAESAPVCGVCGGSGHEPVWDPGCEKWIPSTRPCPACTPSAADAEIAYDCDNHFVSDAVIRNTERRERLRDLGYTDERPTGGCADALGLKPSADTGRPVGEGDDVKIHEVKCWPMYFRHLWDGSKRFEVRKNDREYCAGDTIINREWGGERNDYTGRMIEHRVGYVARLNAVGFEGYVGIQLEEEIGRTPASKPSESALTDEQHASLACGDDPLGRCEEQPRKSRAAKTGKRPASGAEGEINESNIETALQDLDGTIELRGESLIHHPCQPSESSGEGVENCDTCGAEHVCSALNEHGGDTCEDGDCWDSATSWIPRTAPPCKPSENSGEGEEPLLLDQVCAGIKSRAEARASGSEMTCGCPHCKGLPKDDDDECDQELCFNEDKSTSRCSLKKPAHCKPSESEGSTCGECSTWPVGWLSWNCPHRSTPKLQESHHGACNLFSSRHSPTPKDPCGMSASPSEQNQPSEGESSGEPCCHERGPTGKPIPCDLHAMRSDLDAIDAARLSDQCYVMVSDYRHALERIDTLERAQAREAGKVRELAEALACATDEISYVAEQIQDVMRIGRKDEVRNSTVIHNDLAECKRNLKALGFRVTRALAEESDPK